MEWNSDYLDSYITWKLRWPLFSQRLDRHKNHLNDMSKNRLFKWLVHFLIILMRYVIAEIIRKWVFGERYNSKHCASQTWFALGICWTRNTQSLLKKLRRCKFFILFSLDYCFDIVLATKINRIVYN